MNGKNTSIAKGTKVRVSQSALASSAIKKLDALSEELGYPEDLTHDERLPLLHGMAVPSELIEGVAATAERLGDRFPIGFDGDAAREAIAFAAAFAPVARAARAIAQRIEDRIVQRRGAAGAQALVAYAALKVLARTPEGKDLEKTVRELGALLRKPRRRSHAQAATAPQPQA